MHYVFRYIHTFCMIIRMKRLVSEADQSPPSTAEFNNLRIYKSTSPYPPVYWCNYKREIVNDGSNSTPKYLPQLLHITLTPMAAVHTGKSTERLAMLVIQMRVAANKRGGRPTQQVLSDE
jgi:hypothetical protein